jgi:LuxR family transcriptional regulator, maltose regulon positive regulatory protein
MASLLLDTKIYLPRLRSGHVPRPRLGERLTRGAELKLTLISAPAGFGKTTLLAGWIDLSRHSTAWVSLDQSDNHAASFWSYVVAALQTVEPHIGANAIALLQSPQPPPIEVVLTLLLNELSATSTDVVVVLDDYHAIEARDIHDGVAFLLDHLPPRVHLVIASRADPALPLARLRARGELVEIRAADLRFTPDEAAVYLNQVMALDLTAHDLAVLEDRTEGWIAALQLAALSMQGRENTANFIAGFSGDDRYIVDYLVEEVLKRQPAPVRDFLRDTSILDRLSGSLCDAVTKQEDGKAMLEALERANLFVVPLDDQRRWYRYHHLFADVLHARLLEERLERVPELHRRASAWYERNGEPSEAIHHALAARDFAKAADLIELAAPGLRRTRLEAALLGWLAALPDELLRCRPVLSNVYAGELLACGRLEEADARLRDAERWLGPRGPDPAPAAWPGMVVVDELQFRRLPGAIAVHRAGHALVMGNLPLTLEHARRAHDLAPEDDHLGRGGAAALIGLAGWASGDLEPAHQSYAAGRASLRRAGHHADALGSTIALADIRIAQGRLHEALRTYEQALQLAAEQDGPVLRGTADMHVGISGLYREWNELHVAMQHLVTSQELGEHTDLPQNPYRWRVAMARIRAAYGDLDGALDLLQDAERLYVSDFFPNVRPVSALKARVWVAQGKLDEALEWTRERGLSVADDLSYLREFEHITLARVLLARHAIPDAMRLVESLLRAADDGARTASVIELLLLQAVGYQMQDNTVAAFRPLDRALALAEPQGYIRIFVDEGRAMATLLQAAAKRTTATEYVRRLLAASGKSENTTPVTTVLMEPLSERELDVLRLLGTDMDGPDIARQLVVSLSTVRTHTRNIYSKLGVNNRRAAVSRADELRLLTPDRTPQSVRLNQHINHHM